MTSKPRALKAARMTIGLCVAAGLIYFLYSEHSPPAVSGLITLGVVIFLILQRRLGVFDKNPYFRRLAMGSSRKPIRDLGIAIACFIAMMAIVITISIGVRYRVLPDNYVTVGILIAILIVGIVAIIYFLSGVISRVLSGPPPP